MTRVLGKPDFVNFHPLGLAPYGQGSANKADLPQLIKSLNHTDRWIDVLKIDCEGCEFSALTPLFQDTSYRLRARLILVELHASPSITKVLAVPKSNALLKAMTDAGYAIYHKEPNIQYSDGSCTDFGLVLLNISLPVAPE